LIGTTGAGKNTLLRQLMGTHPEKERFPSTSTAKTTVCDLEIILKEQPTYEAVVTFFSYDKIRMYIEECVMSCGKSYVKNENEQTIIRHFLEHTDQRFRLSYIFGNLTPKKTNSFIITQQILYPIEHKDPNRTI
jgi:ABC-type hemin transport system ATPase subunit